MGSSLKLPDGVVFDGEILQKVTALIQSLDEPLLVPKQVFEGLRTVFYRLLTFPLRLTPLKPYLRLEHRVRVPGGDNGRGPARRGGENLKPVEFTKADVQDEKVGRGVPQCLQPFLEIGCPDRLVAGSPQELLEAEPRRRIVFDDQHPEWHRKMSAECVGNRHADGPSVK